MATISENIQRINKAKSDIKNAIIAKGGSVADNDKIDTYATAIEALPSGGGTELPQNLSRFVTDDWGIPKKITIKGSVGTIPNNKYSSAITLEDIIIGNGVTSIGNNAFEICITLTSVTIPDSVTTIGSGAFESCTRLSNVTIGNGITKIDIYAFDSCYDLATITVKAVTPPTLGDGAIPNSVTAIYVPSDSVDAYKSASGWGDYASKIQPIQ